MKSWRAALAAGMMAGLAAVPLSASADTPAGAGAPQGSASASALTVDVSLAKVEDAAGTGISTLRTALDTLKGALCTSPATDVPALVPQAVCDQIALPDLPASVSVQVAHAEDSATLNSLATDIVSGNSSSTPVQTNWTSLLANLGTLQQVVIGQLPSAVAGALPAGTLSSLTNGTPITIPAVATATFNIFGTVSAALPDKPSQQATAVQITGQSLPPLGGTPLDTGALNVQVDPFTAVATNASLAPKFSPDGPQTSAQNTVVSATLPDVVGELAKSLPGLQSEASLLDTLVKALANAVADPSQAGSILNTAAAQVPPDSQLPGPVAGVGLSGTLQTTLQSLGTAITGAATTGTGAVPDAVMAPVKALLASLAATLSGLQNVIDAVAGLELPNATSLVLTKDDIATAKTITLPGGGVSSTATSRLGELQILPIGKILSSTLSLAGLPNVSPDTALLDVQGITSSATAAVGPGTSSPLGTGGLTAITVLGQPIADAGTLGPGAGQSVVKQLRFPGLGTGGSDGWITLSITQGVPQVVADTDTYRAVNMAELDIRLVNGCGGAGATCSDALAVPIPTVQPVPGTRTKAAAAPHTSATSSGSQSGVAALGDDGQLLHTAATFATASASMNGGDKPNNPNPGGNPPPGCNGTGSPTCPLSETAALTSLPKTGMLGGFAIPAGLLLIAVAISLRVAPGLRTRLRRMR